MPSTLEQLKARFNIGRARKFDLFYWADVFMNEYGMSFEEFKKLNFQAFYLLREQIQKRYQEQEKAMKKGRRR